MWLSEKIAQNRPGDAAERGRVTIAAQGAVATALETRRLPLCSPGGVFWRPADGQEVIVLKLGGTRAVAGALARADEGLEPGEVRVAALSGASVTLKNDGRVLIEGDVFVNGERLARGAGNG